MSRNKCLILIIPLIVAVMAVGALNSNVYSDTPVGLQGHFPESGGPGATVHDCNTCHEFDVGFYENPDPGFNLRWVKRTIIDQFGIPHAVNFTRLYPVPGTLSDGSVPPYDGPCQVCHTGLKHHNQDGSGTLHFAGTDCTVCHAHFTTNLVNYFKPMFAGNQAHYTHWNDPKGPRLGTDTCTTYCHSDYDFHFFRDGKPLLPEPGYPTGTNVCDACHGKGGMYDGVNDSVIGAKLNWEDGIYKPAVAPAPWPSQLRDGKENWCAGCHDNGAFGVDDSVVWGVHAPNVMGNNVTYGYNVSGHGVKGNPPIRCDNCHDLVALHTDGVARTYQSSLDNYVEGYRLNDFLAVPRFGDYGPNAFQLCSGCHAFGDITGPNSNFRDDPSKKQLHALHLASNVSEIRSWDSDWRGGICFKPNLIGGTYVGCESAVSCTACHNVHGSEMDSNGDGTADAPCPPMIRHGELISTLGTTDKVPAFDFRWYKRNGSRTANYDESYRGELKCGNDANNIWNVAENHVCWGCHSSPRLPTYSRLIGGPEGFIINSVITTDQNNIPQYYFNQNQKIRYHVDFTVSGGYSYCIKANGTAKSTTGVSWSQTLALKTATLPKGEYDWYWEKTIPSGATDGSFGQVKITVKMLTDCGSTGVLIGQQTMGALFEIQ